METTKNLNIVLIGMPGAGKTFIGNKLAKLLMQFSYIDIDGEIEKGTGLTISEIFKNHGEHYFRDLEIKLIKEISQNKNQIISIGGGAFENDENIKALKKSGIIFYLEAPIKELFNRIQNETHRPLINNKNPKQTLKNLLKKREINYLKADFRVNTEQKQAYTILDDILGKYENYVRQKSLC